MTAKIPMRRPIGRTEARFSVWKPWVSLYAGLVARYLYLAWIASALVARRLAGTADRTWFCRGSQPRLGVQFSLARNAALTGISQWLGGNFGILDDLRLAWTSMHAETTRSGEPARARRLVCPGSG